ncbi:MAG: hypothetical protein R2695_12755 [Acidimicrobiales bacterium]
MALVDEIEAGRIRGLVVTGGNPLTAFPQPRRLRAALETLEVLAVVDVARNELTEIATHVLPATGQLERADITLAEMTALRSGLQATGPVVAPAGERRPVWWMLASASRAMRHGGPGAFDPDHLSDELFLRGVLGQSSLDPDAVFAAGPRGIEAPSEPGWVRTDLLADGRWSIAPAVLLERLAEHGEPDPNRLVLAPRPDGVEQLRRLRLQAGWSGRAGPSGHRPAGHRWILGGAHQPVGPDRGGVRGRPHRAPRGRLDDARPSRVEPGRPHHRHRSRSAHRHAACLGNRGSPSPPDPDRRRP